MHVTIDEFLQRLRPLLSDDWLRAVEPYDDLIEEVGFDSLHFVELLVAIEAMAHCPDPPEIAPPLKTLADAYEYYWCCLRLVGDA